MYFMQIYIHLLCSYKVTLEKLRHNVSNLHRNNVNIALLNKLLKSIYLYRSVLLVRLYQTH